MATENMPGSGASGSSSIVGQENKQRQLGRRAKLIGRGQVREEILSPRAWERWSILISMLDIGIAKLNQTPGNNPIIRSWETKRKGHSYAAVYALMERLIRESVVKPLDAEDDNEVTWERAGIARLENELMYWEGWAVREKCSSLEVVRIKLLRERLNEFKRLLNWSAGEKPSSDKTNVRNSFL